MMAVNEQEIERICALASDSFLRTGDIQIELVKLAMSSSIFGESMCPNAFLEAVTFSETATRLEGYIEGVNNDLEIARAIEDELDPLSFEPDRVLETCRNILAFNPDWSNISPKKIAGKVAILADNLAKEPGWIPWAEVKAILDELLSDPKIRQRIQDASFMPGARVDEKISAKSTEILCRPDRKERMGESGNESPGRTIFSIFSAIAKFVRAIFQR